MLSARALVAALALVSSFAVTACGQQLPSCGSPQVVDLGAKLFRDSVRSVPIALQFIDVDRSTVRLDGAEVVKDGDEMRECRATSTNVLALTPKGDAAVAANEAFVTSMVDAARAPREVHYLLRMNDDRKTFTIEFFETKPRSP